MEISLENLYVVEGSQKRSKICGLFRLQNLLGASSLAKVEKTFFYDLLFS